ncbi:MAG: tandem-95 repeat protein [Chloroflexi bacterium]|nr:tandem-95 repeat protein [Chloroflexota bacterium]
MSNTWLIEVENLSPGEGGVITITGVVTVPLASGLTFTNTAAITCTLDGDWDNNHSDAPVTVLNAPPVAVDDDGATFEETSLTLDVLDNDHDLNGGNLILTGVGDGMSGTTAISGSLMLPGAGGGLHGATAISGSLIIYTPTLDFNGSDSFTYTVEDSGGLSDVGLVNVTVTNTNDAPVAVDDSYVTAFETRLDVPVELGVLDNDSDIDGDSLTAVLDSPPVGALAPNPDGSFIYTPTVGFTGVDTFTYHAYDGQASSHVATVTIIVSSTVNNAPLAVNDSYDVIYETALTVLAGDGVLYNDFDADDDPLTATLDSSPVGALAFDPDGSFIYTSTNGFTGTDTFTYHAYDGLTDSNVATVTLNVTNTVIDHLIYLPLVLKE